MNLLDRLLGHDSWTTHQLLLRCKKLTDEQLDRDFDIAHRTVRKTLEHMIFNVEAWADSMSGRKIRSASASSIEGLIGRHQESAANFAAISQSVSVAEAWDEQWVDQLDAKRRTYGGTVAHVITHNMHHRAQLLYMLRRLGCESLPEGDVLSWENGVGSSSCDNSI
ncbi:DinB family protein [Stratiformator vulcanicus]|uniref:DinB family protein n=1 Tax=Stratiformator vulcanicus TaxID=2527980 RepID=A0A517QYU2_9PLAN|nr:DinB family protein [Stratiformator vulcanicus]QDT36710.1 DinB family protein [Stratiformator vulcanicus]